MKFFPHLLLILLTALTGLPAMAQEGQKPDTIPENVLLEKQWSAGALLHTNGWGLKLRKGYNKTILLQNLWEIEFTTYKSSKEERVVNQLYPDSRSFFYGKLNYVWFLRGGVGQQRVLNRKPYWGGVQLSWIYYAGVSVAVTKPVYLFIIRKNNGYPSELVEEQYDPEKHEIYDIYGRGSFLAGFSKIAFYPGVHLKSGLDFEFGTSNSQINALEVGAQFDYMPLPVPVMAYNPKQSFFLTLYVSVMFGKRYNK
jgi:hypothetical protein